MLGLSHSPTRRQWHTKTKPFSMWRQLSAAVLAFFCIFALLRHIDVVNSPSTILPSVAPRPQPGSKYAFVLFLADYSGDTLVTDEQDVYYIGTRVLVHQLLHNPETRTNTSIPVVILATPDVRQHRIDRLIKDGADVRVVEKIDPPEWSPNKAGQARWADAYAKLRTFQLVEFEKVLFMDSDMLVVKRMDGIFDDPSTAILTPKTDVAKEDEGALPPKYMVAAQAAFERREHSYPPGPSDSGDLSSGFYVCHPSLEIFDYYMRIMKIPNRLRIDSLDQDLMHYAHRRNGPMPWTDVEYTWTSTWPSMKEYKMGAHSLHEKFWDELTGNLAGLDPFLKELWLKAKAQMEVATAIRDLNE